MNFCFVELVDEMNPAVANHLCRATDAFIKKYEAEAAAHSDKVEPDHALQAYASAILPNRLAGQIRSLAERALRGRPELDYWFRIGAGIGSLFRPRLSAEEYDWAAVKERVCRLADTVSELAPKLRPLARKLDQLVACGRAIRPSRFESAGAVYGGPAEWFRERELTPRAISVLRMMTKTIQDWLKRSPDADCILLGQTASRAGVASSPPALTIRHGPKNSKISIDGEDELVGPTEALFIEALCQSNDWVSGAELTKNGAVLQGERLDRLYKKLPKRIRDIVESRPGLGYRLRRRPLA
jgi:hypothetical protein